MLKCPSTVDSLDGGIQALSITPSNTISNETTKYLNSESESHHDTTDGRIPIMTSSISTPAAATEKSKEEQLEETPGNPNTAVSL